MARRNIARSLPPRAKAHTHELTTSGGAPASRRLMWRRPAPPPGWVGDCGHRREATVSRVAGGEDAARSAGGTPALRQNACVSECVWASARLPEGGGSRALHFLQRLMRGAVEDVALRGEARAVAGAV